MGSETVTGNQEPGHARVLHLKFQSDPKDARKKVSHLLDRMTVEGRLRSGWGRQADDRWHAALPNGVSVTVFLDPADRPEVAPDQSWTLTLVADTGERRETAEMFRSARRFMTCRWPGAEADVVMWETQDSSQLRSWLPPGCDLSRVDAAAAAIPRLLAIRHRLRCGDLVLDGAADAALNSGRYPSMRFFLEYWPEISGTEG